MEIQREFEKTHVFDALGLSRHHERGIFFNTAQTGDGFENCIFSSPKSISLIKENVDIKDRFFLMDATFRVSPRGIFNQLLVIHVQFGKKTFPVIYALMSQKTTKAYMNVLQYVHDNLLPIDGSGIIIDFEKAERLAISKLNTGINILGCWFHFCQALRRKMASIAELFALVRKEEKAKDIFSQFQCLPLLPYAIIESTFKDLAKKALRVSTLFSIFIDYFNREWIKIVKPIHFSVFMRGTKSTGSAESFNRQMNQRFKTHGNFYHFCETLQKEEVVIAQQLENYIGGSMQHQKQPKYLKKRNAAIKKYSIMLQNDEISPMTFLATMANRKHHILYADDDISLNDLELNSTPELFGGDDDAVYVLNESSDSSDSDTEQTFVTNSQLNSGNSNYSTYKHHILYDMFEWKIVE